MFYSKISSSLLIISSTLFCSSALASHKSYLMFYNQTNKPVNLSLDYANEKCYHNGGPGQFTVPANWHYGIHIEDSNAAFENDCAGSPKNLLWFVNGSGHIRIGHVPWWGWQSYGQVLSQVPKVRYVEFMCSNGTRSGDGHCSPNHNEDGYMSAIRFCNGTTAKCNDDMKKPFDFSGHWEGEFKISNHDYSDHYCNFTVTADIDTDNNTVHWTSLLKDYNMFHCPITQEVKHSISKVNQKIMDNSIIFAQGKDERIVRLAPEASEGNTISGQGVFGDGASQVSNFSSSKHKFDYWERLERR